MKNLIMLLLILCVAMAGCVTVSGELPSMLDRPVIKVFSSDPSIISAGDVSTLSWTVTGANSAYIDQGIGNVALSGSTTISPAVTTIYTITANNAAGNSTARCQVTVRGTSLGTAVVTGKPDIVFFKADPSSIVAGGNTSLSWDIQGATEIIISPDVGIVEPGITVLVSPQQTIKYTITASNAAGMVSTSLLVTVIQSEQPQLISGNIADLPLVIAESGSLIKSGATYTKSSMVCAGDTTMNLPSRAFLSFDISFIPANAVIEEAVLDLGTYAISGNPVYTISGWGNMGALEVYQYQYGPTAAMGRLGYEFPASMTGSFKLVDTSTSPLKLDVTMDSAGNNIIEQLLSSGQSRCQFRMQFFTTTNWDSKADMVCMDTAVLSVKYSVPK